jgi:hypothetical protein
MILAALSRAMKPRNLSAGNKTTAIQLQEPFLHRDHISHNSEPLNALVLCGVFMASAKIRRICGNVLCPEMSEAGFADDVFKPFS